MIKSAVEDPAGSKDELLRKVEELGTLTAGLHNAMVPEKEIPEFTPEWLDSMELEGLRVRIMSEVATTFDLLRRNLNNLSPRTRVMAADLLKSKEDLVHILKETYMLGSNVMQIRLHGDLHLGQILVADDRMLVTDFEGEPGRSYEQRRVKQPPVKDLAGMIRSFQYAIYSSKLFSEDFGSAEEDFVPLENLLHQMTDCYIRSYMNAFHKSYFRDGDFNGFLQFFIIEKALYELRYEINNRPGWAVIPIAGLQSAIRDWTESGLHYRV
jgi:maltose alpha-D-glucosyltransferase/alpha-amylase